ncbi:hypothetical protein QYE76_059674 [Lolium multiflorum]|uniref:Transposase (putative) gypsy type domain-containing protein n=1 Tax=Lolium multiflorum TaxID=4521 RepID=A0AAD8W5I9_LOLMU|nr:hypothetical protein QYE76_059674 [Lolium multiflorum]
MAAKGWGKLKVTRESLLPYVAAGIIPYFLDRGFALPTSDFLRQLLAFYNIKISDLGPHSVQQIALFVALCECYLGWPPYFPLWVSIFHGRATRVSKSDQSLIPNGVITFQVKSGESFIDMALPKKAQSQWRQFWFYALEDTLGGRIPGTEPRPRRLNVRSLPRDQEEVVREMRLAVQALKDDGLTAANIYNCWLGRHLIPLRCRGHLMWEYRGQNDCTLSTATEWDEAEYRKALGKVTTATFTSFDDGLQPFSEDKPAPQPPEITEGEEDEAEDEGERTESDSVARDFVRLPRGAKSGATSSAQGAPGEGALEDDEGEETTSPLEGKGPAKGTDEPRSKRLCQTVLEGAGKDALEVGARVGPGVKAIPTVKSKKKVLTRPAPAGGAAATRAAKAKKAAKLKKAADLKKAAADPASLASSREEPAAVSKATGTKCTKYANKSWIGAQLLRARGECPSAPPCECLEFSILKCYLGHPANI